MFKNLTSHATVSVKPMKGLGVKKSTGCKLQAHFERPFCPAAP